MPHMTGGGRESQGWTGSWGWGVGCRGGGGDEVRGCAVLSDCGLKRSPEGHSYSSVTFLSHSLVCLSVSQVSV